jgi:ring-1,2-phenylacetyl-CoA epoxidase subunit PaaE
LCATGSGITPIISILKSILSVESRSRIALFYGNRTAAEILFRDEIKLLEDRYAARLSVFHFLSREELAAPFRGGRLDARVMALAGEHLGGLDTVTACFMCGVSEMTTTLAREFATSGLPTNRIHVELFNGHAGVVPEGVAKDATAVVISGGSRFELKLGTSTVLDAALEEGIDLPYSCRMGSCSTCRAKIVAGQVHMATNNALDAKQVEQGYVLTCQCRALTQQIVLDCDVD